MSDRPTDQPPPYERLTVAQCADRLGISEDAVRSRLKRGTLRSIRESGVVYILLDANRPTTDKETDQPTDDATDPRDELIEELRDRVRHLEESNREHRRIIAGLVQRVPELEGRESGQEAPGAPPESPEGYEYPETATEPQSGVRRRPWWRRIFGS